jgi:hypothetical protein
VSRKGSVFIYQNVANKTNSFVKINWDAAVDNSNRKMGIGAIVRDNIGEALATLSASKDYISEPVATETTLALRVAVFNRELGLRRVKLEGDTL